ncbi:hypothetical protein ACN20G_32485 (plasmid) [Streptomyces sp. BI20]|uniref:hypothetical protein n=1 Tax=Streptomyces sp. BI20 TaxID=3403460 RepID=UPI003C706D45
MTPHPVTGPAAVLGLALAALFAASPVASAGASADARLSPAGAPVGAAPVAVAPRALDPFAALLVGSWREPAPRTRTPAAVETYTLRADGTFSFDLASSCADAPADTCPQVMDAAQYGTWSVLPPAAGAAGPVVRFAARGAFGPFTYERTLTLVDGCAIRLDTTKLVRTDVPGCVDAG